MIYCDSAATTPLNENVIVEMNKISSTVFGNPSSIHKFGQESRAIIERSRLKIANLLGCDLSEIIFTGCGTESNNIAMLGLLSKNDHLITTSYEHPAVLKTANELELKGVEVTYIKPDQNGIINCNEIKGAIKENTKLVSVMHVNNELGTENSIEEISQITNDMGVLFHTDAVQSIGKKNISLRNTKIDLLSLSAHKFYGPKGVGALYMRNGVNLIPTYFGGGQEKDLRPGTENISYIHGMAVALELAVKDCEAWHKKLSKFESLFLNNLKNENIKYTVNGKNLIGGILNITFHDILSQDLVIALDMKGYAISGGSACSSGSVKTSTTLQQIKMDKNLAQRTVRISFGKNLNEDDIDGLSKAIISIINKSTLNAK